MFLFKRDKTTSVRYAIHGIGLALLTIVGLAFVFLVHRPNMRLQNSCLERSEQLVALSSRADRAYEEHSSSKQKRSQLTSDIMFVRQRIPASADDEAFVVALAGIAEDARIHIVDYRRGLAATVATHSYVELDLKCTGGYPALCRFIKQVESMPRIAKVSQMKVQAIGESDKYSFDIRLVLYYGLHPPATALLEDAS